MLHLSPRLSILVLAAVAGASGTSQAASPPAAQVLTAVPQPERIDAAWSAKLCALLPQPCKPDGLRLFRARDGAPGDYIALADKPLAMARVKRSAGDAWALQQLHDFSGYRHSDTSRGDAALTLAPALYPLAEGRWAVAVVSTVSDMYSGGGAHFSTADFVPLEAPGASARVAHAGVPFSCGKMVRACFSEKEYKTSAHCHDESSGSLRIAYDAPAAAGGAYAWRYTWLQSEWPAHRRQSASTRSVTRFVDGGGEAAPFCGGPL